MSTNGRRARVAGRLLLCAASIVLAIGLFEAPALLGLVDYRSLFQTRSAPWERPGNRPDARLLYTREGNRRIRPVLTGNDVARLSGGPTPSLYHCDVRYDRDGFRNPRDLDEADVVVLGDSLVEGFHINEHEIVTARLSERLGLTVANLARGGDGPQQELEVLKRYGLRLRPKVCVWTFYEGNDLADAAEYEANQERVDVWTRRPWWRRAIEASFSANSLDYVVRTLIRPEPRVPARLFTGRFSVRPGESVELAFGSGDYRVESPREASPDFGRVEVLIAEAREICREQGIAFVVVFIPTKFRVYRDLCDFDPDSPCRKWRVDDLPAAMKQAVERLGADVEFIDLTRRLQDEAAAGTLVYLPDDTHWSSAGHRVAAEELATRWAALRP
ncbi:MAG: GDSL-type esterase/lipase family protein [Paludisphaera borealis]|uniref:alginate O-acetyltransferase AlgX-related protein n=1 Tax=Paludisphaera borealis TaxID=1387353 RepID=UPI002851177B|nr:GDSL-type esterase/lipase family protein [Paludisphaera borealis]MDR3617768.1 GDSL-type esterase/lipase family protein [Paludisphaera borealis]